MPALYVRPLAAARAVLRGLQPTDDFDAGAIERWRTGFVVRILSGIGSVFLVGLAVDNLLHQRWTIAAIDLLLAGIALGNLAHLQQTGRHRSAQLTVSAILLFIYAWLLVGGGVDGTGPLWCYVMVAMLVFVHGLREGTWVVGGLIAASIAALAAPWPEGWVAAYEPSFAGRFLASLIALFVMALLFEYARERAQDQMARLSARLQETAHTDTLTGLPNRRHMTERIAAEHDRLENGNGDGYALIEVDLDDFKGINDCYGHAAGDRLLARIGERLARGLRDQDVLSRWGGEEFLVLLPSTGMTEAAAVAERVRALVARDPVSIDGQRITVTVSIGLARAERGDSVDNVLQRTDRRMYAAKDRGRDAVVSEDG